MEREPLGPRLRDARERRGLSLRQIATTTKIATVALEALESGEFSRLPGGIYSRAFVRAYAAEVGLDPEESVADFVAEQSLQERDAARIRIRPAVSADDRAFLARQQRAVRIFQVVAVVAALAVLALVVWLAWAYWLRSDTVGAETLPQSSPPVTLPQALPPPPADPVPVRQAPAEFAAEQRDRLVVAFEVTGACWVQITADGLVVLSRLLQAGERETVRAERELVLDVGNTGAFTWSINGRPAQALGLEGRHRQVTITRENAQGFLR